MMRSEAQRRADAAYNKKVIAEKRYSQLKCSIPTADAEAFKAKCAESGTTVNAVLTAAVRKFMEE